MSDVAAIDSLVVKFKDLKTEIGKVIIGQEQAVNYVLLSVICGGHSLNWCSRIGKNIIS